ncbi:hypothetical protein MTO96_044150 [Rhipicephalus appendiculatus]
MQAALVEHVFSTLHVFNWFAMFVLVRFLDLDHAHDTRRYVVRVDDIHNFHPKHETDFDGKAVYVVHWVDGDDTGDYKAQILRLGATEKEAREAPKRIPIPKMIVGEDLDDEEGVAKKATHVQQENPTTCRLQLAEALNDEGPIIKSVQQWQDWWRKQVRDARQDAAAIAEVQR